MFKVKIKFGWYDDVKVFTFNTEEEKNSFYKGLDAAIGYLEYEEVENEG